MFSMIWRDIVQYDDELLFASMGISESHWGRNLKDIRVYYTFAIFVMKDERTCELM